MSTTAHASSYLAILYFSSTWGFFGLWKRFAFKRCFINESIVTVKLIMLILIIIIIYALKAKQNLVRSWLLNNKHHIQSVLVISKRSQSIFTVTLSDAQPFSRRRNLFYSPWTKDIFFQWLLLSIFSHKEIQKAWIIEK